MAKAQGKVQGGKAAAKKRIVKVDSLRRCSCYCKFQQHHHQFNQQARPGYFMVIAGKMGFKGCKKNTPYAAQMAASDAAKVALDAGLKE